MLSWSSSSLFAVLVRSRTMYSKQCFFSVSGHRSFEVIETPGQASTHCRCLVLAERQGPQSSAHCRAVVASFAGDSGRVTRSQWAWVGDECAGDCAGGGPNTPQPVLCKQAVRTSARLMQIHIAATTATSVPTSRSPTASAQRPPQGSRKGHHASRTRRDVNGGHMPASQCEGTAQLRSLRGAPLLDEQFRDAFWFAEGAQIGNQGFAGTPW